jgi:hypothetical protein
MAVGFFCFYFSVIVTLNPSQAAELTGYRNLQRKLVGSTVQQPNSIFQIYCTLLQSVHLNSVAGK